MSDDPFSHDPTDSRDLDPGAPTSFEEAKAHLEEDSEAEGLGFVVNRHDPFLVVEIANALLEDALAVPIERILASFGDTYTEKEGESTVRLVYRGELPPELHGGAPVVVGVGGEETNYGFRLYDSGWTPITGRHIDGTPSEVRDIDDRALKAFLAKVGEFDD